MTGKKYDPLTTEGAALLVKKLALKYWRQACALRLKDLEFEDVEQEIWVTWCKCKEAYNPNNEVGAQFSTYFVRAVVLNMQRFMSYQVRDTIEIAPISVQDFVDEEGNEFEPAFFEVLHLDPERYFSGAQELERAWSMLSPLSQYVISLTLNPPPEVNAYLHAEAEHEALEQGIKKRRVEKIEGQLEFSVRKIVRYLDLPQRALHIIYREIDHARNQVC